MVTNLCYSSATGKTKFKLTETKLYVPVVTLSTLDNAKLLQQIKSGFKRTINWNKYKSSIKTFAQNRYFNHLVNPSFQGVNRLFVLSVENENDGTSHSTYINSMTKTYENLRKTATAQRDDYTTGYLLDYSYFKDHYKLTAIDLSKQQALDADPRAI